MQLCDRLDDSESSKMCFSKGDYAAFRTANRQAIREVNHRYKILKCAGDHDSTNDQHDSFDNDMLVGLEHALTPNIENKVVMCKRQHRIEVLKEQGRQEETESVTLNC